MKKLGMEILIPKEQIRGNVEVKSKDIERKCKRLAKGKIAREIKNEIFKKKKQNSEKVSLRFLDTFWNLKSV